MAGTIYDQRYRPGGPLAGFNMLGGQFAVPPPQAPPPTPTPNITGGGGGSTPASITALTGGGGGGMPTNIYSGGTTSGTGTLSQPAFENQQQTQLEYALRKQESEAKQKRFDEIMSKLGVGQPVAARESRTTGPSAEQEAASRNAAFARAKETAGQTARASMQTLQDVVDERGLTGSSVEAGKAGAIIGGASANIGDFLRDQAQSEAQRATDVADMEYQGQVQQRGQELARQQALLGLLVGGLY